MRFVDSKDCVGIQAVDLIVSGIRKCLRKGFNDNLLVASLIGRLMIQTTHNDQPLLLLSFDTDADLDSDTAHLVNLMRLNAKPMLK
jgi:hypothetical protein